MTFDLWPHQVKAIEGAYGSLRSGNTKVMVQLPTGAGKSATIARIIADGQSRGRRSFVLAHRKELTGQLLKTLTKEGVYAGLIQSGHPATDALTQVCSVQTLVKRLDWFDDRPPNLLVIDEAHHSPASTYVKILDRFPMAKVLGFTATPCRSDGKGLGEMYQDLILGPQIPELVRDGFLVPPRYLVGDSVIGENDAPTTKSGADDLSKMAVMVREVNLDGELVEEWLRVGESRPTIVFCIDRTHGKRVQAAYQAAGIACGYVDGESDDRDQSFIDFQERRIQVLVNINVATEGVDLPLCSCIQLARPTQSVALYYQMIGRGLRRHPDKSDCLILDHAGCYNNPKLGSVMEPKIWTLTSTVPKKSRNQPESLPEDPIKIQTLILTKKIKLEEVDPHQLPSDLAWIRDLQALCKIREERNYKPYWVVTRMQDKHPGLDLMAYKIIAKTLGYHHGWASHQVGQKHFQQDLLTAK